ncbi:hypothetical protein [Nannocystis sp. SCPEA4]|uniref:hypothetical protein n=1 Tax=Nannocystis sp. SCPEA4 TaxID=2996787 RepID=UPI002271510B|nr:hypothetical protein [Nannocystis sp. SCPEA4]MCY1059323.1 hypothetical protein [Nannocystis sp. SCPEA4]
MDGVAWVKNFGPQPQYIFTDLVSDAQGNVIAVGAFWEQVDLGGGPFVTEGPLPDGFIVKYGPLGEHLWSRQFGDLEDQRAKRVALDPSGNILVMGDFQGSMEFDGNLLTSAGKADEFVVKLTSDGDHVWSKSFGGPEGDSGFGVASDSAGNVVVFAQGSGPVDFGGGPLGDAMDAHVVKLSPAGAHLWHRVYSATNLLGSSFAVDANDDIVTMGWFSETIDFGGGPEASLEGWNIYVTKLDSAGQFQWTRQNGGHQENFLDLLPGGGVSTDDAGNIRIAGVFEGTVDFGGPLLQSEGEYDVWIAALSPDGEHMWSSSHGSGPSQQTVLDIATNSAGRTAVAGYFGGTISFGDETLAATSNDAYVARFAPNGNPDLARSFGGPGLHSASAVAIDEDGGMWLSGEFDEPFEVGGELLVPEGEGRNAYLMRMCP